ncbi:MAG TPA: helix-turn-helix domain-containing protein [Nocardioidaceae bacterium]|nr:helix-turn-helix domain-containing protein [Nocardioidaceae bacterium]
MVGSVPDETPRERLLRTASQLFYREGIHSVGVDRILSEAGVTRQTMYRHFRGKEDLVVAHLALEDATIRGLFAQASVAAKDPKELMRLIVDGIAADATRYHTRGCPFINASAEYPNPDHPVRKLVAEHREWFRTTLAAAARAAGLSDPKAVAAGLVLLRDATLIGAYLDDPKRVVHTFRNTALGLIT